MNDLFSLQNQHHKLPADALPVNLREVQRFLGYYKIEPDEQVSSLINSCVTEMQHVLSAQGIYSVFPITKIPEENFLDLGFAKVTSKDLSRNLAECHHCILLAATIGPKVDQLIQKYSRLDPLKGVLFQAIGAMFIESYCNALNTQLKDDFAAAGFCLRPRFSPGYGDFSLAHQKDIFRSIRADKTIGLTLMDSGIMAPSKSVTAVIGVYNPSDKKNPDYLPECNLCENCNKQEQRSP